MSRYIDVDKIEYEDMLRPRGNGNYEECQIAYRDQIDDIPTADVRENVRGEWVHNIHDIPICNQCGYMTPYDRAIDDYEYGNFCPNCGADMRGGE